MRAACAVCLLTSFASFACAACLPLLPLASFACAVRACLFCLGVCCVCAVQYLAVPGSTWRCSPPALLPLLYRDPESPGTAPSLTAYCAGALHAALLYASVTIIFYT